jgi:hypothetical protein
MKESDCRKVSTLASCRDVAWSLCLSSVPPVIFWDTRFEVFTMVNVCILVFWVLHHVILGVLTNILEKPTASLFRVENGECRFLRNVG